jgi:thymidine phosphorylase
VLNDYWTAHGANCPTTGDATGGVLNLVSRQIALILARAGVVVAQLASRILTKPT